MDDAKEITLVRTTCRWNIQYDHHKVNNNNSRFQIIFLHQKITLPK